MARIEWTTGFTTAEKILAPIEVVLAGYSLVIYRRIVRRLRERHSEAWRALGSPTLFSRTAAVSGFAMIQYVLAGGHRKLEDAELELLVRRWLTAFALFMAGMFAFTYQILRYGP